jgi:ferredoxin-NADP reductase
MKNIHYVATLQIKRVEVEDGRNDKGYLSSEIHPGRKVGDVVNLTIRQGDLAVLKQNLNDHLLIIDDDTNIPLADERVARGE